MNAVVKIAVAVAISVISFAAGCRFGQWSDEGRGRYYGPSTNTTVQVDFNAETYVWEGLNFSTNRVK